jgi:hypothetical protein
MGFEVLTPRADGENLLPREEDMVLLPRVGDEGPVPTFSLPFIKFQAVIRLKGKSRYQIRMISGLLFLNQSRL